MDNAEPAGSGVLIFKGLMLLGSEYYPKAGGDVIVSDVTLFGVFVDVSSSVRQLDIKAYRLENNASRYK